MTAPQPDSLPDELMEAAKEASTQQQKLVLIAYAKGLRDGMEWGAGLCDLIAKRTRELPVVTEAHCGQIVSAEFARDQIRLAALQVETPEVSA